MSVGVDTRTALLETRLLALEREVRALRSVLYTKDGAQPIEGILQHTGEAVGFFSVTPAAAAPKGTTAADAIAALQRFGLMKTA